MSMNVLPNAEGIKIYNVSIGKSVPQWITEKKKKALRNDQGTDCNMPLKCEKIQRIHSSCRIPQKTRTHSRLGVSNCNAEDETLPK
jgi:hypothetical protein